MAIKRLTIEIPLELHTEIKKKSAERNITIRNYIMRLIIKALHEEKKYERNNNSSIPKV